MASKSLTKNKHRSLIEHADRGKDTPAPAGADGATLLCRYWQMGNISPGKMPIFAERILPLANFSIVRSALCGQETVRTEQGLVRYCTLPQYT
jgi:hypothetical protein